MIAFEKVSDLAKERVYWEEMFIHFYSCFVFCNIMVDKFIKLINNINYRFINLL